MKPIRLPHPVVWRAACPVLYVIAAFVVTRVVAWLTGVP